MEMTESREMYLETILILSQSGHSVHAINICEYMNFSRPSVSRAIKHLSEEGYIHVGSKKQITLTDAGMAIAKKVYERHTLLSDCLIALGVSREKAIEDACRIEHIISHETFEVLKAHAEEFLGKKAQ